MTQDDDPADGSPTREKEGEAGADDDQADGSPSVLATGSPTISARDDGAMESGAEEGAEATPAQPRESAEDAHSESGVSSAAEGKQPPPKRRRRGGDPVVREAMDALRQQHGSGDENDSERDGGRGGPFADDGYSSDEESPDTRKAREAAAADLAATVRGFLLNLARSPGTRPASGPQLDKMRRAVAYFRSSTMIIRTSRRGRRPVEDDWTAAEPVAKTKEKVKVEESFRNYSWPRLGPRYQAVVPDCAVPLDSPKPGVPPPEEDGPDPAETSPNDFSKPRLCWFPGHLDPAALEAYMQRAEDMFENSMPYEMGMNRFTSVREHSIHTLHRAKYEPSVARTLLASRPFELPEDGWQAYEREQFDRTLFVNASRDFTTTLRALQNAGSRKGYGDVIQHYYRWKTSDGYRRWQKHITRGKSSAERTTATSTAAAASAPSSGTTTTATGSLNHCGICGGGIRRDGGTPSVPCDNCGRALHATCGAQATSGGRGGRHLCNKCLKAQNKRKEAEGVPPSPAASSAPSIPATPQAPPGAGAAAAAAGTPASARTPASTSQGEEPEIVKQLRALADLLWAHKITPLEKTSSKAPALPLQHLGF
eukprot:tig00000459_g1160.t1